MLLDLLCASKLGADIDTIILFLWHIGNVELIKVFYQVLGYVVILLEQRFVDLIIVVYKASDQLVFTLAF